jgi:hypothetical protein
MVASSAGKREYGDKARRVKYWVHLGCWISHVMARSRLAHVLKPVSCLILQFSNFSSGCGKPRITETVDTESADTGAQPYWEILVQDSMH